MKVKGIQAIAEFFEVSERTVRYWRNEGAPISKGYEAELGEIQLWKAKRKRGGGEAARQGFLGPQKGKDYEETRLKRAQADKVEMELAARRGELVPVTEVHKWYAAQVAIVRTGLLSFQHALPPFLEEQSAREIATILHERVRDLLWTFAGQPFKAGMELRTVPTRDEFVAAVTEFYERHFGGFTDES